MYRRDEGGLQVLLVHPGGPFFRNKDEGAWSIPKGEVGPGEDPLAAAVREFGGRDRRRADRPLLALTPVKQKGGKVVHAWASRKLVESLYTRGESGDRAETRHRDRSPPCRPHPCRPRSRPRSRTSSEPSARPSTPRSASWPPTSPPPTTPTSSAHNEFKIRALAHRIAAKAFEQHLARKKRIRRLRRDLPALRPRGRVPLAPRRTPRSASSGPVRYRRAYYLCRGCGKGLFPFDRDAGPDDPRPDPGPGAGRHPGRHGRRQLREGGRTAPGDGRRPGSRVDRRADHRGRRQAAGRGRRRRHAPSGPRADWPWHKDYEGRRCAYVELDATGVRQQGAGGGPAEGRMAYVGMVCNPGPEWPWPDEKPAADAGALPRGAVPAGGVRPAAPHARRARRHGPGRPLDRPDRRRRRAGGPARGRTSRASR